MGLSAFSYVIFSPATKEMIHRRQLKNIEYYNLLDGNIT